jgi:ABC-type nickel/cobalt efflux system permease component RcnA
MKFRSDRRRAKRDRSIKRLAFIHLSFWMFESIFIDSLFSEYSFWFSFVSDFLQSSRLYQSDSFTSLTMKMTMNDFRSIIVWMKIVKRSIIENLNKWNLTKSKEDMMHLTNQRKKTQANRTRRTHRKTHEKRQRKKTWRAREKTRENKHRRQIRRIREKTHQQISQTQRDS